MTNTCACGHHAFDHVPASKDGGQTIRLIGPCRVCVPRGYACLPSDYPLFVPVGERKCDPDCPGCAEDEVLRQRLKEAAQPWVDREGKSPPNAPSASAQIFGVDPGDRSPGFKQWTDLVATRDMTNQSLRASVDSYVRTIADLSAKVAELEAWKTGAFADVAKAHDSAAHEQAQKDEWKDHAKALERKLEAIKKALAQG